MRRFLLIPAILAIASVLLAQSPASSDSKPSENAVPAPATVTGRVVTAAEGNPLKSARVVLIPERNPSHHEEIYAASSDSDGHFTLKGIPAGRYRFFASHAGFVEQHYKAGANGTGPLFSLRPGDTVSDILFRLTAAAVITGRVSNEDGDPMQRVEVTALRRPSEEEVEDDDSPRPHKIQMQSVGAAESDDRGQYRIFGLKPGEYFVKAKDSFEPSGPDIPVDESFWVMRSLGSEYAPVYYPGVIQVSQAQVVPLKAGEEAQADITVRRVKTVEIAGRLIGPTGAAANAFVSLSPADGVSDFDRQDTTDDKGNFHLRNVPEGTYYILAFQREEGTHVYESRARQKIEVGGDNLDGVTISLGGGVTIQGRIKIDGSSSVTFDRLQLSLMPVDEEGPLSGHSEVKKDGSFEFKSIHDGGYSLGVWGLENDAYVKSARLGPDDVLEKGVQVEGNSSPRLEITIGSDGAKLDGSVSDDDGPVIGARVRLVPEPLTPYNHLRIHSTTSDQLGHFTLTDIAPGKYELRAKPMLSSDKTAYKAEPQSISLSENDHKTAEIKLEKPQE
jgi:Carboxypeptidase regulatory-like domain